MRRWAHRRYTSIRHCSGGILAVGALLESAPVLNFYGLAEQKLFLIGRDALQSLTQSFTHFAERFADIGGCFFGFEQAGRHAGGGILRLEGIALIGDGFGLVRLAALAQIRDLGIELGKVRVDLGYRLIGWPRGIGRYLLLQDAQGILRFLATGKKHRRQGSEGNKEVSHRFIRR